ncbi:glycosyl hydrolase family 3 N terminal domain-containing protein [Ilyonectria destructans]|nr:glycosyl hydrolase family 3 N terminal domain-containing protein [Ilyonectria destructans]
MGGRNWEGFSPDPYLSGEAIKYTVMGHLAAGVQTSSKHYIANEQEVMRSDKVLDDDTIIEAVSPNVDDRTLHELYLWPFAEAVKAGTTSLMCSYNRLNSTYACEHPHLLTGILRKELGFRGYVVSDCNSGWESKTLVGLVGNITGRDVRENHGGLIRKWGASATVLLKNDNDILPLRTGNCAGKPVKNIGVFGNAATDVFEGLAIPPHKAIEGPEYGVLTIGGGAGTGRNSYVVSPLEAIKAQATDIGGRVQYIGSNKVLAANDFRSIYPLPDVCVIFLKTFAAETYDRTTFELGWNSTRVFNNVAKLCGAEKTVVVTNSGGINTFPWVDNVAAILSYPCTTRARRPVTPSRTFSGQGGTQRQAALHRV